MQTTLEFSPDPLSDTTPTYTDISSDLIECEWSDGKANDLDEPQAGRATFRLKNTNRKYEPEYAAGTFYPNIRPLRRFRLGVAANDLQGIEFWGDFEQGADGTAPEWTSGNGALEIKAGREAACLSYVSSPTPRIGARVAKFLVASGDQFGASTGERSLVRRGTQNSAFPTASPEGQTAYYQFSFRPEGAWTHPTGWEIFQEFKSDARYGQPIFALETDAATKTKFNLSLVTGNFPTATDATNGTNASVSRDFLGPTFAADVWWDVRYAIHWTATADGWFEWWMKPSSEATWLPVYRYAQVAGIQTLPTTTGDASPPALNEFVGFYRNASAFTNVVYHDGYQVGHSWTDVDYPTSSPSDPAWNQVTWDGKDNILDLQGGNPGGSFENSTTGATATGGGITVTSSTDRAKFGSYSLKVVTDGGGSSQGVRHFKSGGATRFDVTAGTTYTASCWVSSAADFSTWRIGIEFFDAGSVSLGTTQCLARALRNDWRHFYVTVAAPANSVTARIENRWGGTTAGTFYVDGLGFWEGTYGTSYSEGIWYATGYEVVYPDKKANKSEVIVSCVDGFGLLSLEALDFMDPPDAQSYEDVVNFDQPSFYYRLGEPAGTKVVGGIRRKKVSNGRDGGPVVFRYRGKPERQKTRSEVEGVAGPSGTYKGAPTLGVTGLIAGDTDTAVTFTAAATQFAKVGPLDPSDSIDTNSISVECWSNASAASQTFVSGQNKSAGSLGSVWFLSSQTSPDLFSFTVLFTDGTGPSATATWTSGTHHLVGTWDGNTIRLYVDGVLGGSNNQAGRIMRQGDASEYIRIAGAVPAGGGGEIATLTGTVDEVAIYGGALSPARILAHYNAGAARGFAQQAAGTRISAIAASDLWSEANIQTGSFQVVPRFEHGQPKLEEILATLAAEAPDNHFYFDGDGNPVYKAWGYKGSASVQNTLGENAGEIGYTDLQPLYDDDILNTVTASTETGTAQTDTDAASVSEFKPRTLAVTGLLSVDDSSAEQVAGLILNNHSQPMWKLSSVSLNGAELPARTAILARNIGDLIRVKRREAGGTPIDVVTTILGTSKRIDRNGHLYCTWNLARGFNAASGLWRAGISGFSEAGATTVAY